MKLLTGKNNIDMWLSTSRTVKISESEVSNLIVKELIMRRNVFKESRKELVESFDNVIRWYLDADEFQRFVINCEEVE